MRNKPDSRYISKTLLFISCITIGSVSVAQGNNGKPFQDLQNQIDELKALVDALGTGSAGPIELDVNCGLGESVNDALNSVTGNDSEVIVNVLGQCAESVIITRDDVTIRGADSSSKIQGIFAVSARRGASRINVESITLTGSFAALSCFSGASVSATNVIMENSGTGVMSSFQGSCIVIDSLITGNNQGVTVSDTSNIYLQGSIVEG